MAWRAPYASGPQAATEADPVSFRTFCETSFARRFDLLAFQRCFPDRAAQYFRATGLSATEIGAAFGVNARTAQNWLDGIVAPRGDKIAVIALCDPDGFRTHFTKDAA
jgi:hypothetical protein